MSSKQKVLADREQFVVKSNDLIRKTRYDLTTQQQKVVLYAISKIKPDDDINTRYEFNLHDLCRACGIRIDDGGYYYTSLKDDLVQLTTRQWVTLPDGTMKTISWIGDSEIVPQSDKVYIKFNEHLQPYLFDLHTKYTQYRLQSVLVFRGKYSIRLYEILRSYTTQRALDDDEEKEIEIEIEQIRYLLAVEETSYPRWADFNRFVLKPAVKEINEKSEDIHIEYFPMKRGKKVVKVDFIVERAPVVQQVKAYKQRRKKLDHKEIR